MFCYFFVRGHLFASFFCGGFTVGGLWSFPCFASFLFILLLMLSLSLVFTICFGCVVVSGCVLVWICDWFAKILVDVLKLSWHFGDRSLIFVLKVEFGCPFLDEVVTCPLVIYCFHCWYYFFVDSNLATIYLEVN